MNSTTRCTWTEKFTPATAGALLSELDEGREAAEEVRGLILADESVVERVSWEGVAWRWCFVYTRPGDAARAWAYLVPDPAGPRLCIPLPAGALERINLKRVKKPCRDAITQGQVVRGVRWVCFALENGPSKAEIEALLRAKREACGLAAAT